MQSSTKPVFHPAEVCAIVIAGAAALLLGAWGYAEVWRESTVGTGLLDWGYAAIGLFIFQLYTDSAFGLPWQLEIARILAPACLSYAAIKGIAAVLHVRMRHLRTRHLQGHTLILGLSDGSMQTLISLRADGIPVVVLDNPERSSWWQAALHHGAICLPIALPDPLTFTRLYNGKARYVLAASDDDGINAEAVYAINAAKTEADGHSSPLLCAASIDQPAIASALNDEKLFRTDRADFSARVFNYAQLAARHLLLHYGIDRLAPQMGILDRPLRVLLLGDHQNIDEVILRFAALGHYSREHLTEIRLRGEGAAERLQSLRERYPALPEILDISAASLPFSRAAVGTLRRDLQSWQPDIAYICGAGVEQNLVWTRTLLNLPLDTPVVVAEFSSVLMLAQLNSAFAEHSNVHVAHVMKESANYRHVFGSAADALAQAAHEQYVADARARGESPAVNSALVPWRELPEIMKEANRSQVDHALIKARLITRMANPTAEQVRAALTREAIESLAEQEHRRWMADKLLTGWMYTDGPKDFKLHLSPALKPWSALDEDEREKDRSAVRKLPELIALLAEAPARSHD